MGTVLVVLRLGLAAIFATAGVGKLLDRSGSQQALLDFGLPATWGPSGAIALPVAELLAAIGLIIQPTARWAAVAATLLLGAFIVGISVALSKGQAPDCHCFGQIHSSPAGKGTLVRNGALAAVAVFVVFGGSGPSVDSWVTAGDGHPFMLAALIVVGLATLWLTREAERRAEARVADAPAPGLQIGGSAPAFDVPDLEGGTVSLEELTARGKPVLLVFTHQGCGPCTLLLPELARWQAALSERITVAVVSGGSEERHRALKIEHGFSELLLQAEMEVFERYQMVATPGAVLISVDGRIDGASVFGSFAIEQLTRLAIRRATMRSADGRAPEPFSSQRFAGPVINPT
jgi:methylamine dehydrogenase accessory protein MauD